VVGEGKAERQVGGVADADAGGDFMRELREIVLEKAERAFRGEQVEAVVERAGDGQGLAEAAGAGGEVEVRSGRGEMAVGGHGFPSQEGLKGADEDAASPAFGFAGDIDAVVHAVDQIHVSVTGRAEHDLVAGRGSAEAVGGGVGSGGDVGAEVGFYFDDAAGEEAGRGLMGEDDAEELRGDDFGRRKEEGAFWGFPETRHLVGGQGSTFEGKASLRG